MQPFAEAQIKENIKTPSHWPLWGEFPEQRASNAEKCSIWWRHHEWAKWGRAIHKTTQIQFVCTSVCTCTCACVFEIPNYVLKINVVLGDAKFINVADIFVCLCVKVWPISNSTCSIAVFCGCICSTRFPYGLRIYHEPLIRRQWPW